MLEIIKILENKLLELDLTAEDKEQLSDICKKLNKSTVKSDFKLKSTLDCEKGTKSLMNVMIEEIEEKKNLIQKINDQLEEQKEEILTANEELTQQKEEIQIINKDLQHKNEEISSQKDEIEAQRDEIESQRDMATNQRDQIIAQKQAITDSIEYASIIQNALLPPDDFIKYLLPKYFILHKPRDIVSGDFYWLRQKDNKIIIIVADCTGHGVPGAFMSMLGSTLLAEIINTTEILQANEILNELREQVMISLRQTGQEGEAQDGMDLALCILDKENKELQFAGANNPLYIISNSELKEIKGDGMPVGISPEAGKSFTNHVLEIRKGDSIYMFSDGYVDQFGGSQRRKFKSNQFKQLLLDIQDKIMYDQKQILDQTINKWMNYNDGCEQIDDILVMGIKI